MGSSPTVGYRPRCFLVAERAPPPEVEQLRVGNRGRSQSCRGIVVGVGEYPMSDGGIRAYFITGIGQIDESDPLRTGRAGIAA
ncbi:hypothetical protein OH491_05755 [Termitidicoccus mucosus]|uniref:hypothetical protein n=1 Tax=Termitidicoccus mucosus TaxID=1184151 RepID=UPI0011AB508D